jgi:HD superfamily phosphohydrolase
MRRKIIINDPIHKVMSFGSDENDRSVMKAIIDTEEFQRLRRISQLGLASYAFPGATHSRFCHSLGAAYLASCVLDHLIETQSEDEDVTKQIRKYRTAVILSSLLHDIGHGPFSHSFEKVLKGFDEIKELAPLHEDWTAALIKNSNSSIYKALQDEGFDTSLIASPFEDEPAIKFPRHLKQIISSQLDVDRMDYLLRDSHFAGVALGAFDVHYLINCITLINHDSNGKCSTLGLTKKGVKAYESYAISRQMMNRSLYFHHRVKTFEFMIEEFTRNCILECGRLKQVPSLKNLIPPYFYAVHGQIKSKPADRLSKNNFIKANFQNYINLTESEIWSLVGAVSRSDDHRIPSQMKDLAGKLLSRDPIGHKSINAGKEPLLRAILEEKGYIEKRDFVIVDLPSTMYKKESEDKVFVVNSEGTIQEITSHSEMMTAFHDRAECESLLILIDPKKKKIFEHAEELRAISTNHEGRSKSAA